MSVGFLVGVVVGLNVGYNVGCRDLESKQTKCIESNQHVSRGMHQGREGKRSISKGMGAQQPKLALQENR